MARANIRGLACAVGAVLLVFCTNCSPSAGWLPEQFWVVTDVAVADVNGDGRSDVITLAQFATSHGSKTEGQLDVYLQTPTPGVFSAPVSYFFGHYPWRLAVADIDGDTNPDLVITDVNDYVTWLMLQDSARPGQFLDPEPLFARIRTYDAVIGDFNNDGVPDIAVTDSSSSSPAVVIRYQDTVNRGTFGAESRLSFPGAPYNLAAGDVDGDGLADLLAWVYTNPKGVYPPTGGLMVAYQKAGGFDLSGILALQTGHNVSRLAVADANGDTRPDLFAFEKPFSADYSAQLVVVPQSATEGIFDAPITTSLAEIKGRDDVVLADFNQDHVPDVAVVGSYPTNQGSNTGSRVNLLLNDGFGRFTLSVARDTHFILESVAAGDLNGDSRNDIVLLDLDNQCLVMFHLADGTFQPPQPLH